MSALSAVFITTNMSFERFPSTRLDRLTTNNILVCKEIGLSVESTTRVKGGMMNQHTVTMPDGSTILKEVYSNDLTHFVKGIIAANSNQTKPLPNE
jgi:hypothetical protein